MHNLDLSNSCLLSPREATCPACGYHVAVRCYDGGSQPLATLAWPASSAEAESLQRFVLDFVRCVDCGHVFNPAFDYRQVPYSRKPNLMFNRGIVWSSFIKERCGDIMARLPDSPRVVEIGHGDGSFLQALAVVRPQGRYTGFDPHGASQGEGPVTFRADLFDPSRHLEELQPDIIISRHVLEHLTNPLGFLQRIAFTAHLLGRSVLTYFEVPCIDTALATERTVDFYYEHSSQFTSESFTRMLTRCHAELEQIGHGYNNEVIYCFARLGGHDGTEAVATAQQATAFYQATAQGLTTIGEQLAALAASCKRVAIWGGTGKSAAFLCRYGVDRQRFPVVVDSDPDKVGSFVPGMGQEIRFRDYLKEQPVEVLIIPPQWRAADILLEMQREGIAVSTILVEDHGQLVPYAGEAVHG